ncbi:MAG TPA: DMT family transporter [Trueperaceae bacterium]|nr:DMT family transporter [Trueperaceae bacterium]
MSTRALLALLALSAIWGASFLFMRVAAPVLGPLLLIELRVGLAGLALLLYGLAAGRLRRPGPGWWRYVVVGVLQSALPFTLFATASLELTASFTATLNATTPIVTAVLAAVWLGDRLGSRAVLGLLLGLLGVAVLVGFGPLPLTRPVVLAIAYALLAAASYGFAAVFTRLRLQGEPPLAVSAFGQSAAALLLLPLLPFNGPVGELTPAVVGSVLGLSLVCTALAFLVFYFVLQEAGPTRATTVTYLSPAFGIFWGWLLLDEPLAAGMFVGFGMVLLSVALVAAGKPRRAERQAAPVGSAPAGAGSSQD